jgi:hypothetical protein
MTNNIVVIVLYLYHLVLARGSLEIDVVDAVQCSTINERRTCRVFRRTSVLRSDAKRVL